jgi:hypothetical protein
MNFAIVGVLLVLCQSVMAGELVFREFPVPDNDPVTIARSRKIEKIYAVVEEALKAEGLGGIVIDSVEWREQIPSERRKTPLHVVKHDSIPPEKAGGSTTYSEFSVSSKDSIIFRFGMSSVAKDPYRFRVFDEGWVLEVKGYRRPDSSGWSEIIDDVIVLNGVELNQSKNVDGCWGYRHVDNKPFFFFARGDTLGWSFDGVETVSNYETIEHDRCCKDLFLNPHFFYNALSFYASRDGLWYQVVGMIRGD